MSAISTEHIRLDENGVARLIGKRTKVIQIVMDRMANGWDADEIARQYPHLSLAEIHAAFAYYYDHREELDAQIEADYRFAEQAARDAGESPIVAKLKREGHLPR